MFGGDPFGDPFNQMRRQMQEMDHMMNSMMGGDPFAGMLGPMMGGRNPMITNGNHQRGMAHNSSGMMLNSFGGGLFGGLMQQMNGFQNHAMNDPNSTVFTQSTMISYGNDGKPHVVQSSTRKAGDVKETRHSVQKGNEHKLSVGHAIGDRAHFIEKKRDKDGRIRQQQKFVNLDEDEAEDFNREFKTRATNNLSNSFGVGVSNGRGQRQQAIENGSSSSSKSIRRGGETAPIVTVPDDDEEEEVDYRLSRRSNPKDSKNRYLVEEDDDDVECVYSGHSSGPTIREISDEEADMSNPKRRKGLLGKFLRSNNE